MTDHINSWKDPETGRADHTRPATLEVYEAVATLAADTGYSKPTTIRHLQLLRGTPGKHDLHLGQQWQVLRLTAKARQWQAARYELDLKRLEALADPRRAQTTDARQQLKNLTPEPADDVTADEPQELENFTSESSQGCRNLTGSGQEILPELPKALPKTQKNLLAHARETMNGTDPPGYTPTPDRLDLPEEFLARCRKTVPELDVVKKEIPAFLGYCRRHEIFNQSWLGAFWDWLLKAQVRYQRGEPTASHPHPGRSTAASTATTTRTTCSWNGCNRPPCGHRGQACWDHGCCEVCDPALAAAQAAWEKWVAGEPETTGTSPAVDEPGISTTLEPPPHPVEASAVEDGSTAVEPEAEGIPVSALEMLASALARQHTMRLANPRAGPLGTAPPRRRIDGGLREDGRVLEQDPEYLARMRARKALLRAQAAQLTAAGMAAD